MVGLQAFLDLFPGQRRFGGGVVEPSVEFCGRLPRVLIWRRECLLKPDQVVP